MTNVWSKRFELLRGFGWIAAAGLLFGVAATLTSDHLRLWAATFAILLFLPAFLYTYVLVIWHWKDRYRGKHSDLWGALILIEASGWFKLVYLFRHLIPDMRHTGRYTASSSSLQQLETSTPSQFLPHVPSLEAERLVPGSFPSVGSETID
jgi:hypothetical protein